MPTHQLGDAQNGYVDKRRGYKDEFESRNLAGPVYFTANATGTTTTMVGANATPSTNTNNARLDDEVQIFTAAGVLKHPTVFRITAIAVAGSTTLTFTPAAPTAPVSTDFMREVGLGYSTGEKDRRLVALGFSAARVATMTENDKDYQIRTLDDPGSLP
jgi:hypothetical protein